MNKTRNPLMRLAVIIIVSCCALTSPCQVSHKSEVTSLKDPQERTPRYLLRPGDMIELQFEFSPEFNQSITVQPDGFIALKGVPDMHVSGLSVPELVSRVQSEYAKFLHQPAVSAFLRQFEHPYYVVGGMVSHPGKYDLA